MALNDYEISANLGQPVELYEVRTSASNVLRYTDADAPVIYDGHTYEPKPLIRSELVSKAKFELLELKLTVPYGSEVGDLFLFYPPSFVVNVTIRQGHVDDPSAPNEWEEGENFPVAFSGKIVEALRRGDEVQLTCEHIGASMRRPGLRRHYQWACPLVLYGPRCRAAKTSYRLDISAASGNAVTGTLSGTLDPLPPTGTQLSHFVGGMIQWNSDRGKERRRILRATTTQVFMDGPATGLPYLNSEADIFRGCPHTFDGCRDIHGNIVNYGGQPWIPTGGNPIGKNNHF